MIIKCMKCNKMIQTISIEKRKDTTYIHAQCHGETDTMTMTDQWQHDNQDFVYAINNNMTIGEAFRPKAEEDLEEV